MQKGILDVSSSTFFLNRLFPGKEPWQVSALTTVAVLTGLWIWNIISQPESIREQMMKKVFHLIKKIPKISKKIEEEQAKVYQLFEEEVIRRSRDLTYITTLPDRALQPADILNIVKNHLDAGQYKWREGYVSGTVYYYDQRLVDLTAEVNKLSMFTNPLHPDVFPGVCKMEAEIIKIIANLLHGSETACGTMTSGGTESILMACKAYRDYGLRELGIRNPEIVIPVTAHAAFDKAGLYLGIRVKHVIVDKDTWCVNIKAMEQAISRNTVMLAGSTPNFPYGTVDDIEAISKLGLKYRIPVHVDCCLGSFVAVFLRDLGYDTACFDFSLPGVKSISLDTHKYGFAPKGSSVILYSEPKYRHYQYFTSLSWPGGLYGSPSVGGSRSGAIIASCWATLMYFGKDGYKKSVQEILHVSKYIETELRKIKGIFLFGKPFTTVIAIGSKDFHIYRLADALSEKSWNLNMLQFPFGIHICLTQLHTLPGVAERFVEDVRREVEKILENPTNDLEGKDGSGRRASARKYLTQKNEFESLDEYNFATISSIKKSVRTKVEEQLFFYKVAMYGMSTTLPDRTIVGDFTKSYLDAHFYTPRKS